ncbi:hypothetical protein A6P39_026785 [Streptomyces sp. FXJ1.172]|uniref:hypothetical protein n=1 Tax=Streptomyces sp. FXJ1.172 TaxID=710705 RepID=UPI0007CF8E0A|nr:hypothetical protein [Streptomyces sp. FXJ1.172]WEO97333.1 hypothetical protein A6P39_026785 [Streptomyces sp. FXJ1.172]
MRKFLGPHPVRHAVSEDFVGAGDRLTLPSDPRRTPVAGRRCTTVARPRRTPVARGGCVNPPDDVLDSTISAPGPVPARRISGYDGTPGHDSDLSDLGPARRHTGDRRGFRLVSLPDAAWAGVLFVAVDAQV